MFGITLPRRSDKIAAELLSAPSRQLRSVLRALPRSRHRGTNQLPVPVQPRGWSWTDRPSGTVQPHGWAERFSVFSRSRRWRGADSLPIAVQPHGWHCGVRLCLCMIRRRRRRADDLPVSIHPHRRRHRAGLSVCGQGRPRWDRSPAATHRCVWPRRNRSQRRNRTRRRIRRAPGRQGKSHLALTFFQNCLAPFNSVQRPTAVIFAGP
jgi:hypothetical protein